MDAHPEAKDTYSGGMEAYPGVLEGQRRAVKGHLVAAETLTRALKAHHGTLEVKQEPLK